MSTYQNYINGEWVSTAETMESINPADITETVGVFPNASTEDLERVVHSAKAAAKPWKDLSATERGGYLHKAADILESKAEDIAITATKEMGKTLTETKGEVNRAIAILRYFAQEGFRSVGENIPSTDSKNLLYTTRVPLGVVGVITPWNFPIAIPVWKIAPALVYGNTVILKPASETAITAIKIIEAFAEAGFPPGVVNIITGRGSLVGGGLTEHKDVSAVTFTGSNQTGRNIAATCVSRGAKYQLEMGGKNPAIIAPDADLDFAVELTVNGAMKHTGQKCTATSRVFIHEEVYDVFKDKVLDRVKKIKIGSGLDTDVYMGPVASKAQQDTVLSYI